MSRKMTVQYPLIRGDIIYHVQERIAEIRKEAGIYLVEKGLPGYVYTMAYPKAALYAVGKVRKDYGAVAAAPEGI